MALDRRFWLALIVFQVGFGIAVFSAARWYYQRPDPAVPVPEKPSAAPGVPDSDWTAAVTPELIDSFGGELSATGDPVEISRRANEAFGARDYPTAARYYERLLEFDPLNADVRNNLALTLQYLQRSEEALMHLRDNVAAYPEHQRSWLTLGFVLRQTGDAAGAREALATAVRLDPDSPVGQSAGEMLDELAAGG